MAITPQTVTTLNGTIQELALPDVRVQELPEELNQLCAAAVANRARVRNYPGLEEPPAPGRPGRGTPVRFMPALSWVD